MNVADRARQARWAGPSWRHVRRCALYFVSRSFSVAAMITRWHWAANPLDGLPQRRAGYVLDHETRLIGAIRTEG